jgi:hypothetical protein
MPTKVVNINKIEHEEVFGKGNPNVVRVGSLDEADEAIAVSLAELTMCRRVAKLNAIIKCEEMVSEKEIKNLKKATATPTKPTKRTPKTEKKPKKPPKPLKTK